MNNFKNSLETKYALFILMGVLHFVEHCHFFMSCIDEDLIFLWQASMCIKNAVFNALRSGTHPFIISWYIGMLGDKTFSPRRTQIFFKKNIYSYQKLKVVQVSIFWDIINLKLKSFLFSSDSNWFGKHVPPLITNPVSIQSFF